MADNNWVKGFYEKKINHQIKDWLLLEWQHILHIYLKKVYKKNLEENFQESDDLKFSFDADFQIESYLRYQGSVFVDRFDASSYLYITRAMDYFDLSKKFSGNLSKAFEKSNTKFFIISFTSDWLYPTSENREIVIALNSIGKDVGFAEITSDKGHDSFLLDVPDFLIQLKTF